NHTPPPAPARRGPPRGAGRSPSVGGRGRGDDWPSTDRKDRETDRDPDELAQAPHQTERHPVGGAEPERDKRDDKPPPRDAEPDGEKEGREAHAGAEGLDH